MTFHGVLAKYELRNPYSVNHICRNPVYGTIPNSESERIGTEVDVK